MSLSAKYVRDLIRRDKERAEREAFERLEAELQRAFAAPDESCRLLDADTVIRHGGQPGRGERLSRPD